MCARGSSPAPASAGEALAMARAALEYLNAVDVADLDTQAQAECLAALELLAAKQAAAQARLLAAFTAGGGHEADGQHSAKTWLRRHTRVTRGAAAAAVAAARRLAAHPAVARALAEGVMSVSWAREVCEWTAKLPAADQQPADEILVLATARGADLAGLAQIAAEIYQRVGAADADGGAGDLAAERYVRLETTFGGAGRLAGDLTPEAAAAARAVLDALGRKAGQEDTRTAGQRQHDALAEACRRLLAAGLVPGHAGGDTRAEVVIGLRDLRALPGAATAEQEWIAEQAARQAAGAAALSAPAAAATACAAALVPVVTGHIDHDALEALTGTAGQPGRAPQDSTQLRAALLRWAVEVVSGPAGLASRLRRGLLEGPLASQSLPLDIGTVGTEVPAHLRRALIARDRHCAFPGCEQPPQMCQPHHIIPRSKGGPTALHNLMLGCLFHHLIVIHTWGWQVTLNPDGTVTATSPTGKILHSHSPPTAA